MRKFLSAIACLAFVSLVPQEGAAYEPRAHLAAALDRSAERAPSIACGDGGDCALAELQAGAEKPRRLYAPPPEIRAAIEAASAMTGTDFVYLLKTAMLESSFDPEREVSTSSAKGLYQFVEQTWLYMMHEHGAETGLWEFAESVTYSEGDGFDVEDERLREFILWLRYDPELSALFAAAFTRRNAETLARKLGRGVEPAELYVAHVLGSSGAAELIQLARENPKANACKAFARAARANRAIFYDRRKPRTAEAVLNVLMDKYFDIPVDTGQAVPWRPHGTGVSQPVRYLGEHTLIYARASVPGRPSSR